MDQPRLYKIFSIPLLISLIIIGMMLFISDGTVTYSLTDWNNTSYQELYDIGMQFHGNVTEEFDVAITNLTSDESDADKEGNILSQSKDALNVVTSSYSLFGKLISSAVKNLGLGEYGKFVVATGILLVITVFIFGIGAIILLRTKV